MARPNIIPLALALFASACSGEHADEPVDLHLIPPGSGWRCLRVEPAVPAALSAGDCYRSPDLCDAALRNNQRFAEEAGEHPTMSCEEREVAYCVSQHAAGAPPHRCFRELAACESHRERAASQDPSTCGELRETRVPGE